MGWILYIGTLFKIYCGVNMGISLIQLGADMIIAGLKLLIV
jgi:hypothetical protein